MRTMRFCPCGWVLAQKGKVDVVGPVCESGDFFARDRVMAG